MQTQAIGWGGAVLGIVLILLAVFAEQIGIGGSTYGIKHILTLAVGAVLIVAGAYVALRFRTAA